jgi:hypothetical protein
MKKYLNRRFLEFTISREALTVQAWIQKNYSFSVSLMLSFHMSKLAEYFET